MTDAYSYSRPERFTELQQARRVSKRMKAVKRNEGLCALCVHRETTFGLHHCKNKQDRRFGQCELDGKSPKFEVDTTVVEGLRDAA